MNQIVLVRSSRALVDQGYVGYGWEKVKFDEYSSPTELIENGFKSNNIPYGRKRKQIMLFHSIKKDDIVIVPVSGAIAIGLATNEKVHEVSPKIIHSENRIKVEFFKNDKGDVLYVSLRNCI